MLHIKFGFDWPTSFRGKWCLNIMVIYMYIAPGWGHMSPLGSNFFQNHWYSVLLPISSKTFTLNDILKVLPIHMHWRPMLTLPENRSRSSQGHDLYTHCSAWAINASCQVLLKSIHRFWRRRFLKGFYQIWAWRPSWSCDLDFLYTHWFPLPIDASYKIWLWLAKRFQRRRSLKLWTDGRTDGGTTDHGHPISSPCEPNGSGELKREKYQYKFYWKFSIFTT